MIKLPAAPGQIGAEIFNVSNVSYRDVAGTPVFSAKGEV